MHPIGVVADGGEQRGGAVRAGAVTLQQLRGVGVSTVVICSCSCRCSMVRFSMRWARWRRV